MPLEPFAVTIPVRLGRRSYPVCVTSNGLAEVGRFASETLDQLGVGPRRRAVIVTDEHVQEPHARTVGEHLDAAGFERATVVLPAGETTKTLARAAELYDRLLDVGADRQTLLVAVGGGVVGDLAGFVAATYQRGVPFLQVPTSLLAQVDASVGGKVGVNHPRGKNMIGAFYQPIGVWIDTEVLGTLPPRELRCGLAEVVKYGVILDAAFFSQLERDADAILGLEPGPFRRIIARSCELKAHVVAADETETTGLRAVLNYGHTFGHAIEAVTGYGPVLHGEAVAIGMVLASRLAERIGWIDPAITARQVALLERFGLPTRIGGLDPRAVWRAMGHDKKNQAGRVRFILPRRLGQVELCSAVEPAMVTTLLAEAVR